MEIGLGWPRWFGGPWNRAGVRTLEKRSLRWPLKGTTGSQATRAGWAHGDPPVPTQPGGEAAGGEGRIAPGHAPVQGELGPTASHGQPRAPSPALTRGRRSLGTDRGLLQAVEVNVQVGVDAVRGSGQRDAVDQEHEQHEVRQRGRDPHDLAVHKLVVRAAWHPLLPCPQPWGEA